MTKIFLVRHGETDWNKEGRYQGQSDTPLNDMGRIQAKLVAQRLASEPIAAIYSSDLLRAMETAWRIASFHGLKVISDKDLREMNYGSWEGRTTNELKKLFPEEYNMREKNPLEFAPHNGENRRQLYDRVVKKVIEIASNHQEDSVAIVAHGGSCSALASYSLKVSLSEFRRNPFTRIFSFDHCSISVIEVEPSGEMRLRLYNSTSHLRD